MTLTTRDPDRPLEIHVLGAGVGESIVIRLPTGRWGVVDCYSSSALEPSLNATLEFLKKNDVGELEFICLTHPHDDHYRGMSHLLDELTVDYFWRFPLVTRDDLEHLLFYLKAVAEEVSDEAARATADDLQKTFLLAAERRAAHQLSTANVEINKVLYPVPSEIDGSDSSDELSIRAIAPSGNEVARFHESLKNCFTSEGYLLPEGSQPSANCVSSALRLRYGNTIVILGGDVEQENWLDTLKALTEKSLSASGVKVSHHGSVTGYSADLWQVFSDATLPVAVIAPSVRHRLPRADAVKHIQSFTSHVFTTCRDAIVFDGARFDLPDDYDLELQLAIRSEFSFCKRRSKQPGICSLYFDNSGAPPRVELSKPAAMLRV